MPRKHEEVGRGDGAGRENDLPPRPDHAFATRSRHPHADGALVIELHAQGLRLRENGKVRPGEPVTEIGASRIHAAAIALVDLVEPDAFLRGAVEIRVPRKTGLHRGLDESPGERAG